MNLRLFLSLTAMSFLWIGSQIPLYLFGSVLPAIYTDVGGVGRYQWMVIAYLIPNAALCPFVGNLSDMFGRRVVAAVGQMLLIIGPIVVATATTMNTAIGGQVISGLGAGLNELIALAGTAELVPSRKRGTYVGAVVFTILPFCPSVLWAQLILRASTWRYVGLLVALWNFIGLVLCVVCYKDPARNVPVRPRSEILKEIDYIGGLLSTAGVTCFMMGMQWGASQVSKLEECQRPGSLTDSYSVYLGQRPRPRPVHSRHRPDHLLLHMGVLLRKVPDGASSVIPKGSTNHDLCTHHDLLQRWQLLRLATLLANAGL